MAPKEYITTWVYYMLLLFWYLLLIFALKFRLTALFDLMFFSGKSSQLSCANFRNGGQHFGGILYPLNPL